MSVTDLSAPEWFTRAIAAPRERRFVEVEGCPIHYAAWGDAAQPGLLIMPPGGGHTHWFDHVAPFFAEQFHVVVMDPSGCGDSGRRETYAQELVTAEIAAVCADAGLLAARTPPILVGHSAGAQCVVRAAIAHGERFLGVIAIDGLRYARLEKDHAVKILEGGRPAPRPARVYDSYEDAVARFRLSPPPLADVGNDFIVEHIARHSFREVDGGWTAKYDTAQGGLITLAFELLGELAALPCRAASLYAEHTHVADETAPAAVAAATGGKVAVFRIPGATHYPMIDNPFAFVAAINGVALSWIAEARARGGA
jgi:pimeloyl-ACP methyl ester carboxylesterase